MSGFAVVLAKECRDNARDKRTLFASFSLPLLGPTLFIALMSFVLTNALGESRETFRLAVVGAEHAPRLMDHLARFNVELARVPLDDPRQAVRDGDEKLVLVIDPTYPDRYRSGETVSVTLIYDSSSMGSERRNFERARQMIDQYARKIGVLRVQLRGIDPTVLQPIQVTEIDVASPAARALTLLSMLPYFLVLVVFMGGFYLAIDATAGEREHGSLEPLLSQPISRTQLVLGKIVAASVFSAISTILFLVSLAVSVPFVPLHRVGMSLSIGFADCVAMFAVSVPLILLGAALLTVVASFARSYKEAQTYLSLVVLVPTLPLIVTQLLGFEPDTWLMLVPSLSQATLVNSLIEGDRLVWSHVAISVLSTGTLAALLTWVAVRLYSRERMLV
ncbi:MAG TPA: ABC transporter permease [Pseudomonadales bacterium]